MNKLIVPLLAIAVLAGCADGNIHPFLNSDFLNTTAPDIASLGKMFYRDRYALSGRGAYIDPNFANSAPDHIGNWDFVGFSSVHNESAISIANYYDSTSVKQKGSHVEVATLEIYSATQHTKSNKTYLSAVIVYEVDCAKHIFKYRTADAYTSSRPNGLPVSKIDKSKIDMPTYSVGHETIGSRLISKVCS